MKRKAFLNAILICAAVAFFLFFGFTPFTDASAANSPITVSIEFDRQEAAVGEEITASYLVTGGNGNYSVSLEWDAYSGGVSLTRKKETAYEAKGTFSYTPEKTDETIRIYYSVHDSDRVDASGATKYISVSGCEPVEPLSVTVEYGRETAAAGEEIAAAYTVTGGSGTYTSVSCKWIGYSAEAEIEHSSQSVETASGTLAFTTEKTDEKVRIDFFVIDSDGRQKSYRSSWLPLTGYETVEPVTVALELDKKSIKAFEEITASYSVTGGSGEYSQITAELVGYAGTAAYHTGLKSLDTAEGTVSYTPDNRYASFVILVSAKDSAGRKGYAYSEKVTVRQQEIILAEDPPALMRPGAAFTLNPAMDDGAEDTFSYTTTDADIVDVDKDGVLTAGEKEGTAAVNIRAVKAGVSKRIDIGVTSVETEPLAVTISGPSREDGDYCYTASAEGGLAPYTYTFLWIRDEKQEIRRTVNKTGNESYKEGDMPDYGRYACRVTVTDALGQTVTRDSAGYVEFSSVRTKTGTRCPECGSYDIVTDEAKTPSCTEDGLTEGSHCSVCGTVLVEQEVTEALGHDWDEGKVTKEATGQAEGVRTFTCRRCGGTKEESIARLEISTGWQETEAGWAYVLDDGTKAAGWLNDNGTWYYMDAGGIMQTGWVSAGGDWYYMESSGAMATGWVFSGGDWYYMKSSGAMATGWVSAGGDWYYMKSSGAMAAGWVFSGGNWYYMKSSGAMATGWVFDGGNWYYMESSGVMATGWKEINGQWEMFAASGEWLYTWQGE